MLVFLVGYMGSGKSSIGRKVAARTGMRFIDMDSEIESRHGLTVQEFFARHGEDAFREEERKILRILTEEENAVIATGGGVPCFFDNMEVMNSAGMTVYLNLPVAKLAARLETGKRKRPLLKDKTQDELEKFIEEGLKVRDPFYSQAKVIIACGEMGDEKIIQYIVDNIGNNKN